MLFCCKCVKIKRFLKHLKFDISSGFAVENVQYPINNWSRSSNILSRLVIFELLCGNQHAEKSPFRKLVKTCKKRNVNFISTMKSTEEDHNNATLSQHYFLSAGAFFFSCRLVSTEHFLTNTFESFFALFFLLHQVNATLIPTDFFSSQDSCTNVLLYWWGGPSLKMGHCIFFPLSPLESFAERLFSTPFQCSSSVCLFSCPNCFYLVCNVNVF